MKYIPTMIFLVLAMLVVSAIVFNITEERQIYSYELKVSIGDTISVPKLDKTVTYNGYIGDSENVEDTIKFMLTEAYGEVSFCEKEEQRTSFPEPENFYGRLTYKLENSQGPIEAQFVRVDVWVNPESDFEAMIEKVYDMQVRVVGWLWNEKDTKGFTHDNDRINKIVDKFIIYQQTVGEPFLFIESDEDTGNIRNGLPGVDDNHRRLVQLILHNEKIKMYHSYEEFIENVVIKIMAEHLGIFEEDISYKGNGVFGITIFVPRWEQYLEWIRGVFF